MIELIASTIGVSEALAAYVVALLSSLVAGLVHGLMPTGVPRHVFSVTAGVALTFMAYGTSMAYILASTVLSWLVLRVFPSALSPHLIVNFGAMGILIAVHVLAASGASWREGSVDMTGSLMVVTSKLCAMAFDVHDGTQDDTQLSPFRRAHCVRSPSLLATLGYVFQPTSVLVGPFCHFSDYLDWCSATGDWASAPGQRAMSSLGVRLTQGLRALVVALVGVALHLYFGPLFNATLLYSAESLGWSLGRRLLWAWGSMIAFRSQFYFAWKISEAANCLSGFSFQRLTMVDGTHSHNWKRSCNVEPFSVELCSSMARLPLVWNTNTGIWLRHYVYERLTRDGERPTFVTLLVTQLVSGIWHGLYAGYGLFFASSALAVHASRALFRIEQRLRSTGHRALHTALQLTHTLLTALQINYLGTAFLILTLHESLLVWHRLYYLGHVAPLVLLFLTALVPPKSKVT